MLKCLAVLMASMLIVLGVAPAGQDPSPKVSEVPVQPLLAQVTRLVQALDQVGDPLPAEVKAAYEKVRTNAVKSGAKDADTVKEVQHLLDPLCLAAVEVNCDKTVKLTSLMKQPELVEQGWRTFLIKVVNP